MTEIDLAETTWIVTGASSGLGRLTTERLLATGARVAAVVRRPDSLDDLRDGAGDRLLVGVADVTDAAAVRAAVDGAFARFGRVDVVLSNAGYGLFCSVEEASDDQVEQQLRTNVLGSMHVVRAALPHLRRQGGGRVLQVSSAGGQTTYPGFSYYHASKWAIEGFCQTLALETAPFGIATTIVEPGATGTGFAAALVTAPVLEAYEDTPAGHVRRLVTSGEFPVPGDAGKVVDAVLEVVASGRTPLRLPLGPDTYADVRADLRARLEELEAQREVALSTAATAGA
ncbi:SDR family oxidoreductase [Kineococcus terrestris]|uniref:SDR family oxidoreductase n=1 Tax=Kineococcus terrestris TaxID=2044856 RepID=UPI0034DB575F